MHAIAIITTAFGYGLDDRQSEYEDLFAQYGLTCRYCTREQLVQDSRGIEGVIVGVERADKEFFDACSDLRVAMKFGVGLDNFDAVSAKQRGIRIANLPGINSDAVAEMAITLMLAVSRGIVELHASCLDGQFSQLCTHSILGKTLGIVGVGSIGRKVAAIAGAFGMRVLGYDAAPFDVEGIEQVPLEELLSCSDVVSIHVPLTQDTRYLLDERRLRSMKRGAILVNTSRGGIVDEQALAGCLNDGHVGGAAFDVYESRASASALLASGRAVCTPHVAAYTHETLRHMERTAISAMARLLDA